MRNLRLALAACLLISPFASSMALADRLSYQAVAKDVWKLSLYDAEGRSLTDANGFFSRRSEVNGRGHMNFSMSASYPATFVIERPEVLAQFSVNGQAVKLDDYKTAGNIAAFVVQRDGKLGKARIPRGHRFIDWDNIGRRPNWVGVASRNRGKFVVMDARGDVLSKRDITRRGLSHQVSWREGAYPVTFIIDNYKKAQVVANGKEIDLSSYGTGAVAVFQMDEDGKLSNTQLPSSYQPVDWAELERQETLAVLRHAAMQSLFLVIQDPKYNQPSLGDRKFEVTTKAEIIRVILRNIDVDLVRDLIGGQDGARRVESSEHAIAIDAAYKFGRSGVHVTIDRRRRDVVLTYGDSGILKGDI